MGVRPAASVRVRGLSHRYPGAQRSALCDVAFEVRPGQRLGLLGPNGAGKSTLMRILCGFLPVQGSAEHAVAVEVAGHDVRRASLQVREQVGYLPEQVPLYPELRVREHLSFRAAIKRVPRRRRAAELQRVAELTGIADRLQTPIGQLSRGYRQRVGIADALLGSPPLVVLDEPTVGLDPNQVRDIREMLRNLGGAQTLVFSSHILAEVEMLCDRVVILSQGQVAVDEPLRDALAAAHLQGRWRGSEAKVRELVQAAWRSLGLGDEAGLDLRVEGEDVRGILRLRSEHRDRIDDLLGALGQASLEHRVPVLTLHPGRTRLEERFAEVTGARRAP